MSKSDAIFYSFVFLLLVWIFCATMWVIDMTTKNGESALLWLVVMWLATIGFYLVSKLVKNKLKL